MTLSERILKARGVDSSFLSPDYSQSCNDPFLLPDVEKAIERLKISISEQEKITIYGDYDIDGLSATALLYDALKKFGFKNVDTFIPNRFSDGFGLNIQAIEKIIKKGTKLIITVDCGSTSVDEIKRAKELGCDVIVTDHHDLSDDLPPAVAVINPHRRDSKYLFVHLAGVGVAFALVKAMQTEFDGLPEGQEKWMLDLVALGTVCDSVELTGENRANVLWGLKVLAKTKRHGLKSLMKIAEVNTEQITSRTLGFLLGPRMNAAGRLETAQHALDMLLAKDPIIADKEAKVLDVLNQERKAEQYKIFTEALKQAEKYDRDYVLVLSAPDWNHGIVGIVASKILEKYHKPTIIIQEIGDESKGSARSYGDFDVSSAIRSAGDLITKGGGHKLAAGLTLPTQNIDKFRKFINKFYSKQGLEFEEQEKLLLPQADTEANLEELDENLIDFINSLEPFGVGNTQPILRSDNLEVIERRQMGSEGQHVSLYLRDKNDTKARFVAFNKSEEFVVEIGDSISVWYQPVLNEWNGRRSVEGRILYIESNSDKSS